MLTSGSLFNLFVCLHLAVFGLCAVDVTHPESGSIIVGAENKANITLFCIRSGTLHGVIWTFMDEGAELATLTSITTSTPGFLFDGVDITNTTIPFATNLTILELTEDFDRKIIFCGVPGNLLAANFSLRIYRPPSFVDITQSSLIELTSPNSASVISTPPAFPTPQFFQWTRDGVIQDNNFRLTFAYETVTFNPVNRTDAGTYVLTASNYECEEEILSPPNFNCTPSTVMIGSDMGSLNLEVLSPSPQTLVVTDVASTDFTLYWEPPIFGSSFLTAYTVYCRAVDSELHSRAVATTDGNITTANITGLNASTTYECYVTANTSAGESEPSPTVLLMTAASAPQMFILVSTGLTSLAAFWEPPDPSNDIIYSYRLYCRAVEGSFYSGEPHPETDNIFNLIESTNVTHVTITGLNALADYECYVTASTGEVELEGVPSNTVRVRTGGFEGDLNVFPDPVIGYEGGAAVIYCGPIPSGTLPSLAIRLPGGGPDDFRIIDSSDGRLTTETTGGLVQFTYSGLMRTENGSNLQCNSGVTPSNIITLLVYSAQCNGSFQAGDPTGEYNSSWTIDGEVVTFTVSATTTGWVGIGFPNTININADIIIGASDGGSNSFIEDRVIRFTSGNAEPTIDASQDIFDTSVSHQGGITTMVFSRTRSSSDPDDVSLTECRFIYALWGGNVTYGNPNTIFPPAQDGGVTGQEVCFPHSCSTASPNPIEATGPPYMLPAEVVETTPGQRCPSPDQWAAAREKIYEEAVLLAELEYGARPGR